MVPAVGRWLNCCYVGRDCITGLLEWILEAEVLICMFFPSASQDCLSSKSQYVRKRQFFSYLLRLELEIILDSFFSSHISYVSFLFFFSYSLSSVVYADYRTSCTASTLAGVPTPPPQWVTQPPHSGPLLVLCPPLIISHHGRQSHLRNSGPRPVSPLLRRPHLSHRKSHSLPNQCLSNYLRGKEPFSPQVVKNHCCCGKKK